MKKIALAALATAVLFAQTAVARADNKAALGALGDAPAPAAHWDNLFFDFQEPNPDAPHESGWTGPKAQKFAYSLELSGQNEHGQHVYMQTTGFKNASAWDLWNDPRDTKSETHVPAAVADSLDASFATARADGALAKGAIPTSAADAKAALPFTITYWGGEKGSKMTRVTGYLAPQEDGSLSPVLDAAHESLRPLLVGLIAQARAVHAQDAHLPDTHYGTAQDENAASIEVKGKVSVDPATGDVSVQDGKALRKVTNEPFASILKVWAGQKVDIDAAFNSDGSMRVLGDPEAIKGDAQILDAPGGNPVPALTHGLKADKFYAFTITGEKDGYLEVEVEDQAGLTTPRRAYVAPSSVYVGKDKTVSDLLAGTGVAAAGAPQGPRQGIVDGLAPVTAK